MACASACRTAPDPGHMQAVNDLLSQAEAAVLTLNELDRGRYHRADSIFRQEHRRFDAAFMDTLERGPATILGQQYLALRAAAAMDMGHGRVLDELAVTTERLVALRSDLSNALIDPHRAATAIATERTLLRELMLNVQVSIDNYRMMQRTAEQHTAVDSLLSLYPSHRNTPSR